MRFEIRAQFEELWKAQGGWNKARNMSNRAASALDDGWMTIPILQKHLQASFKVKVSKTVLSEKLDELQAELVFHHIGKTMQSVLFYSPEAIEELTAWIEAELKAGRKLDAGKQVVVNLFDGWDHKQVAGVQKGNSVVLESGEKFRIPSRVSFRKAVKKTKDVRGQFHFHSILN